MPASRRRSPHDPDLAGPGVELRSEIESVLEGRRVGDHYEAQGVEQIEFAFGPAGGDRRVGDHLPRPPSAATTASRSARSMSTSTWRRGPGVVDGRATRVLVEEEREHSWPSPGGGQATLRDRCLRRNRHAAQVSRGLQGGGRKSPPTRWPGLPATGATCRRRRCVSSTPYPRRRAWPASICASSTVAGASTLNWRRTSRTSSSRCWRGRGTTRGRPPTSSP